jgi:hypothetical protein
VLLALHHLASTPFPEKASAYHHVRRTISCVGTHFRLRPGARRFSFQQLEGSLAERAVPLMVELWDASREEAELVEEMFRDGTWRGGDVGPAHLAMLRSMLPAGEQQAGGALRAIRQGCLDKAVGALNSGVFVVCLMRYRDRGRGAR